MRIPDPPYFVWDGDCGFCGRWAGWLDRTVRPGVALVAYQDLDVLAESGLVEDDVHEASWWIPPVGEPLPGAAGLAAALRHGEPRWARALGRLLDLPGVRLLAREAYGSIAEHRHRLPAPRGAPPERPHRQE